MNKSSSFLLSYGVSGVDFTEVCLHRTAANLATVIVTGKEHMFICQLCVGKRFEYSTNREYCWVAVLRSLWSPRKLGCEERLCDVDVPMGRQLLLFVIAIQHVLYIGVMLGYLQGTPPHPCFAMHNSAMKFYVTSIPSTPDNMLGFKYPVGTQTQSAYFGYRFHPLPFPLILHSRMSSGIFSIALIRFCSVTPIPRSHL